MEPLIIEVAVNGTSNKARNPNTPVTPDEVTADALACLDAGASIVHTHLDDYTLAPGKAAERYLASYRPILAKHPQAILYPTINLGKTVEERFAHVELLAKAGAITMGFSDSGSVNMARIDASGLPRGGVYANPWKEIEYVCTMLNRLNLGCAISIFEPNFLRSIVVASRAGILPRGSFVKFYLSGGHNYIDGSKAPAIWGLPPTATSIDAYLEMMDQAGLDLPWAVTTIGGDVTANGLSELAIRRGGHIRLGLEDFGGPRQPRNAELIEEVTAIARKHGRAIATPPDTARILGMPQ